MTDYEDVEGHPDARHWLADNKAAIASYEEASEKRRAARLMVAAMLAAWGVVFLALDFIASP